MNELAARAEQAIEHTQAVRNRICGACTDSCCLQGTMMGSHDLRRLLKGMHVEVGREDIVRTGLRERAEEIHAEAKALRMVSRLATVAGGEEATRECIDKYADELDSLATELESDWLAQEETLQRFLRYVGIRSQALRELGTISGGYGALANLGGQGTSFRFRGRRIAPPKCLFLSSEMGCLADNWKPGKCANFYCAGEPNVIKELQAELSFDEFVLGNSQVMSRAGLLQYLIVERELGPAFIEPKIVLGSDEAFVAAVNDQLVSAGPVVELLPRQPGTAMLSSMEVEELAERYTEGTVAILPVESIDGSALYELAIALDRFRAAARSVSLYILAEKFKESSKLAHPLWTDNEMSQPLGSLEIITLSDD